jgi:hypothetical protein
MDDDAKKIRIENVQGGDLRDQQALKRNYFYPTGVNNTYQFFDPGDDPIVTDPPVVATGFNFSFTLNEMPDVNWTITNFNIDDVSANGNWTNSHKIELDEGEFHAQAGGGAEEDTSSAAAG